MSAMIAALGEGGYPAREVGAGGARAVAACAETACVRAGLDGGVVGGTPGQADAADAVAGLPGREVGALRLVARPEMGAEGEEGEEGEEEEGGVEEFTLKVDGITCGACVSRIEKGLGRVDGIEFVSVSLANNTALGGIDRSPCTPHSHTPACMTHTQTCKPASHDTHPGLQACNPFFA